MGGRTSRGAGGKDWCEGPRSNIQKSRLQFHLCHRPSPCLGLYFLRCKMWRPTIKLSKELFQPWLAFWVPCWMEIFLLKWIRCHWWIGFLIVYKTVHSAPPIHPSSTGKYTYLIYQCLPNSLPPPCCLLPLAPPLCKGLPKTPTHPHCLLLCDPS